jgi:hypothetical protein
MSLIAELKRRNVFRVGVAYAIVAWLLACRQLAETSMSSGELFDTDNASRFPNEGILEPPWEGGHPDGAP